MNRPPLLAPFAGWLIRPEWAARVIAGAYDAKSPAQRRAIVESNPYSYLGVTRSAEDLDAGDEASAEDLVPTRPLIDPKLDELLVYFSDNVSGIIRISPQHRLSEAFDHDPAAQYAEIDNGIATVPF